MSNEKPYSDSRWNEKLKPEAVREQREFTEEEKKRIDRGTEKMLRFFGVLKPDEKYNPEDFPDVDV